jgi:hypothetical protein
MRHLLANLLVALPLAANAQQVPCGDRSLPAEHRWNPSDSSTTPRLRAFYDQGDRLSQMFNAKAYEDAVTTARSYLAEASFYRCNWNYGNAIHDANVALGMAALKRGNRAEALEYLGRAGKSPGSPQLDSFGPTMHLAKELAAAGEREAVLSYLDGVKRFWKMDQGAIERWKSDIRAGRHPDFATQLRPM